MLTTQTNKETCCKCSQHNQINNFICSTFLCLVVLWIFAVCVLSNCWNCFLNLQVFFYLQRVSLFGYVVSIIARVLSNCWNCFLNLQVFFYLQRVSLFGYVVSIIARVLSNWWNCFLNLQVFFYLQHVELSWQGRINARASRGWSPGAYTGNPLAAGKLYFSNNYLYGSLQQWQQHSVNKLTH